MRLLRKLRTQRSVRASRRAFPVATPRETQAIATLKDRFAELSASGKLIEEINNPTWQQFLLRLAELVETEDVRQFLQWDVIRKSMFVADAPYVRQELAYLQGLDDWSTRWGSAIRESHAGLPTPCHFHASSSGNLIHHAYHVAQYERVTEQRISELQSVFEFGGGYGSMRRLFHNLGFRGSYVIFDMPPFSLLQEYYLDTIGLTVQDVTEFAADPTGTCCVSNLDDLRQVIDAASGDNPTQNLFLATWSLSECPLALRGAICPMLSAFGCHLIGFQAQFEDIDNVAYFRDFAAICGHKRVETWPIQHLPGNHYLVGPRSTTD
ncbi:MAG: hypothetical protein KDA93_09510 [Planctomycetaceae bacterium]|nr:hypothetical protein [Planctomycetaceae bacterium]